MMFRDVFISYSTHDLKTVVTLVNSLEKKGLSCWFSDRDIAPGANNWSSEIVKSIDNSGVVVMVLSENSNRDENGQIGREIIYTINKKKPLVPFRIDNVSPSGGIGLQLTGINYLDAYQRKFEPCVLRLEEVVRARLAASPFQRERSAAPEAHPEPLRPKPEPRRIRERSLHPDPPARRDRHEERRETPWRVILRWAVAAAAATFGVAALILGALTLFGPSRTNGPAEAQPALQALVDKRWAEAIKLANGAGQPPTVAWPYLVRAQADYCQFADSRDPAQRTAEEGELTQAAALPDPLAAEAQFRLGAQYMKGDLQSQSSPDETRQRAARFLQASAAQGYRPAQVFLNAMVNSEHPVPGLPGAAVDDKTTWPPGLYPMSCDGGLDLNVKRWS